MEENPIIKAFVRFRFNIIAATEITGGYPKFQRLMKILADA